MRIESGGDVDSTSVETRGRLYPVLADGTSTSVENGAAQPLCCALYSRARGHLDAGQLHDRDESGQIVTAATFVLPCPCRQQTSMFRLAANPVFGYDERLSHRMAARE